MSENILTFQNISKSFFGIKALQNVTLNLEAGQILGLIGENGAGKSTLMNILGGVIQPDQGKLILKGKNYAPQNPADASDQGIAFIHQELNLFSNLSIADNIFIDRFPRFKWLPCINRQVLHQKTSELLATLNLKVTPDTLIERLSPGERQLVEIAKALSIGAEIVIFDEPTTSLTAPETARLFELIQQLRADGKTIIYISHVLRDVLELADSIAVLQDGKLMGAGPKSEFTIDLMISMMVGRALDQLFPTRAHTPTSKVVLELKQLSQPGIVKDVCFKLHKNEVLGLFGLMGSGRTELVRIIFGLDAFETGEMIIEGVPIQTHSPSASIYRKLAFVTENRREEGLMMEASLADNIALVSIPNFARSNYFGQIDRSGLLSAINGVANTLHIRSDSIERQLVKTLSGGNQQKVVIGKWLMAQPSVFIIDEPTRGIDVGAKYEVYTIINNLAASDSAVLFVSSELEELLGICDRILVMRNGQIQGDFARTEFNKENIIRAAFGEFESNSIHNH